METPDIDIIIIKGAPASGKTQTAKELAKYFPKGVRIEIDNLRSMVISVDWTNQEEHIKILNLSTRLVQDFNDLGFNPIIVIDTFSGDKINTYLEALRNLYPYWKISIFGLYTAEYEIKRRLDERTIDEFKDFIICKKINEDTLKYCHEHEIQIDTTELKSKDSAKKIYERLMTMNTNSQYVV
jgi:hypothetical protein